MAYKKNNSPIKQSGYVAGMLGSNIFNNTVPKTQGVVSNFVNTPRPTVNTVQSTMPKTSVDVTQMSMNQSGFIKNNTGYIKNQTDNYNNMSYDNTTGPRPMAPINPKGFSNTNNIQQMFGGAYGKSPLAQVDVDPLTGQPIDPLYNQSPTQPLVPDPGSAMSPPQVPFGVQQPITPPYGLSN